MKTLRKEMETLTNSQKGIKETFENYQKGNGNPHKRSERKSKKEMKTLRKEMETLTNSRKGNRKNMKTLRTLTLRKEMETLRNGTLRKEMETLTLRKEMEALRNGTLRKEMETLTLRKEMETLRNGNIKAARSFFSPLIRYVHGSHSTRPWISTGRGTSMKRKQTNVREAA